MRTQAITTCAALAGLATSLGCGLLEPYDGNQDIDVALDGGSDLEPGQPDLINPERDMRVWAINLVEGNPLFVFDTLTLDMTYDATEPVVIGQGYIVRNPARDEVIVKWQRKPEAYGSYGLSEGTELSLDVQIRADICASLSNDCHGTEIHGVVVTEDLRISNEVEVPIVLNCAPTCEAESCVTNYADGCQTCAQPEPCAQLEAACSAGPQPWSNQAVFELVFGEDGLMWMTDSTCELGQSLCEDAKTSLGGWDCALGS